MVEKHKNYLCAEPFLPPWIHLYMIFKDLLIQTNLPTSIFSMSDDFGSKKTNLCRPNSWQLHWAAKRSKSRSASLASTDGRTDASQSFFAFVSFFSGLFLTSSSFYWFIFSRSASILDSSISKYFIYFFILSSSFFVVVAAVCGRMICFPPIMISLSICCWWALIAA